MATKPQSRAPQKPAPKAPPPPPQRRDAGPNVRAQGQQTPQRPQEEKKNLPAPRSSSTAPAHLQQYLKADANKGLSKDQADNLVPLIYKLQKLSPQVEPRNAKFIEGAAAGQIWLRNFHTQLVDGESEGILFQPCSFSKCVLEFKPRESGGGFVARHQVGTAAEVEGATQVQDPKNPDRMRWVSEVGNELNEMREHVGILHWGDERVPYVLPMGGSDHSVSRGWMTTMNRKTHDGQSVPSWAMLYRVKTTYRENEQGNWFGYAVEDTGEWVGLDDYLAGRALFDSFNEGAKQAGYAADEAAADGVADGGSGGDEGGDDDTPV